MSAYVLHENATILCKHGGTVRHQTTVSQVKVSGMKIVVQPNPHSVSGCPLDKPCVLANWTTAASRVKSFGQPVLYKSSQAICPAPSTGVNITATQQRVKAT